MPSKLLALPAPLCDEDRVALVVCGLSFRQRRVEPAGHAFHAAHERPLIEAKRRPRGGQDRSAAAKADSDGEPEFVGDAAWKKKKREAGKNSGALKLGPLLVGADLYALLEVSESASAEQIKKQYRKLALQHHPDKQDADDAEKARAASKAGLSSKDELFVKIQEAYEVLSDPAKRRQYDSTLDFDESIPDEVDEKQGFYKTFAPVFRRNARWSNRLPVPDLGDESTEISKVHKFYDFWFNFDTWRDFSMHDEYNLDDAEFREERRWMERQNQKVKKRYEAEERKRLMRLAETAERLDPRIRAEKEEKEAKKREEKERRARLKQEEEDAKLREAEERRKREEQEQAEREEKERIEREARKQGKQVLKGLRQRLRKCVQGKCSGFSTAESEELQEFCIALEAEPLEELCGRLEALSSGAEVQKKVRAEISAWKISKSKEQEEQARQREEIRKREEQKASEAKGAVTASGPAWSTEELGLLAKGLQKFPGGLGGRWTQIMQMLHQSGFPRSEKEVVEKTKELSEGKSLRSMGSQLSADWKPPGAASAAPKAKAAAAPAVKEDAKKAVVGGGTATANGSKGAAPTGAPAAAAGGPAASTTDATAEWSAEQQKALEAALQKHPASLDKNERWRLIAEEVPGKTKGQCVERFKYLREQIIKQKKG